MYVFTLEGLWPHKIQFQYSIVRPSDEFHGSSQSHGYGSWPECKVALRAQTVLCFGVLHMLVQDFANINRISIRRRAKGIILNFSEWLGAPLVELYQ